jgi:hypothetical protein
MAALQPVSSARYVANPINDTLEAYLVETLFLLEVRFTAMDFDKAGYFQS